MLGVDLPKSPCTNSFIYPNAVKETIHDVNSMFKVKLFDFYEGDNYWSSIHYIEYLWMIISCMTLTSLAVFEEKIL